MNGTQRRQITRNREMLACTECRRRKTKCNRASPCGSCVRRGDEASCAYQRFARGSGSELERRREAESRLEHLEQLVQQLAQTSPSTVRAETSGASSGIPLNPDAGIGSSNSFPAGPLSQGGEYNGSTHWSAMLEDIEELRFAMGTDEDILGPDSTEAPSDVDVLFGSAPVLSYDQVLTQYLPSRQEADRIAATYFRARAVAAPFIQSSQFQRQYQVFWQDPSRAPPLWTSILFTIFHIATTTLLPSNPFEGGDMRYSIAAAHCLRSGGYFKPKRFAVEALLLYAQSRLLVDLDVRSDVATILSLVIRLASKQGYHRDPENLAIPAFEKEMRRRTWTLCLQLDLLTAFQFGLPSNVQFPTWDTKAPSNLLDSDFDEDTAVLPPPRPDTELTDIMFYNAKHKLIISFEKVLRHTLATTENDGMNVDELDAEIIRAYDTLPTLLRPRQMTESVVDPPYLIVTRLCVYFMRQKSLCVLHRKYVTQGRLISIQTCYQASSDLVRTFLDAYTEFQPGGQNESERWFMSAITWHDYLIGVTTLCLVVCALSQNNFGIDIDGPGTLELLRRAQVAAMEQSNRSVETQRAYKVLRATIAVFEAQYDQRRPQKLPTAGVTGILRAEPSGMLPSQATTQDGPSGTQGDLGAYDWGWGEALSRPVEDQSWAYLEQFLNLSKEDLMSDL